MLQYLQNLTVKREQDGASAVEYGLLVAGIAALIVAVVFLFGGMISNVFNNTCATIQAGKTVAAGTKCS